uniref:Uncharacterized protein n=1 Tax=Picea sitchensis TaxID=3332 RepID=D5A8D5_PICSI|nr:unknown [Picea sitchensis]
MGLSLKIVLFSCACKCPPFLSVVLFYRKDHCDLCVRVLTQLVHE